VQDQLGVQVTQLEQGPQRLTSWLLEMNFPPTQLTYLALQPLSQLQAPQLVVKQELALVK
jgi:hypothetical protein